MATLVDTNVLVRFLTGDPPDQAAAASALLRLPLELLLPDVVFAEVIFVLGSYYKFPRSAVAERMRAALALANLQFIDRTILSRSLEVYEHDRLDYAEAYLVALAEATGVDHIASFDKAIDRVATVQRLQPGQEDKLPTSGPDGNGATP